MFICFPISIHPLSTRSFLEYGGKLSLYDSGNVSISPTNFILNASSPSWTGDPQETQLPGKLPETDRICVSWESLRLCLPTSILNIGSGYSQDTRVSVASAGNCLVWRGPKRTKNKPNK